MDENIEHIKNPLKFFLLLAFLGWGMFSAFPAFSQGGNAAPVLIRDTEIEATFKEWLTPLLKAAGMGPESVNLIIVQSNDINAFVAGGSNIFIYTGLIDKTDGPEEIIGVMAHELGHIAGGHLIGARAAMERASYESILGMVLGVGTALATGHGEAISAAVSGSNSLATRRLLANSRMHESSADQAALRFFESAGINPSGLRTFLEKLESEELLPQDQQSAYMLTHPLNRERVENVKTRTESSAYKNTPIPEKWREEHARMKAKLLGFTNPGRVPWVYNDSDQSMPARYARAIAAYRDNRVQDALKDIDGLIATEPSNPYFQELKGQMLRDFGRVAEAIPYYKKAVSLKPDAGLIRIDLGHALLESGGDNPKTLQEAIDHLKRALLEEPHSTRVHRLLATAYGRLGQDIPAKLHLAEEAVLQRRLPYAKSQADSVVKSAKPGSREWIEANDILAQVSVLGKARDDE